MVPHPVVGAIVIALVGWFATLIAINRSSISAIWKRRLMLPSWIPWLGLALVAPILSGMIPFQEAINFGGALTTGMLVSVVISHRTPRR